MGAKDMQQTILQVKDLCKKYSAKADYAVQNVTFDCAAGEVVGILGHNGAGKSTTLKCLEGMIPFDKGEISVCGFDVKTQAVQAKSNMGFVTDDHAVFVNMTGLQYLEFMCDVYKVPAGERQSRLEQLQQIFDLGDSVYDVISSYSHGMKQKICMMGSLMHRPKLWILDEPMTGLDPVTMRSVLQFMRSYVSHGNAILFSSHDLNVVAKVCDRVVMLRKGKQLLNLDVAVQKAQDPNFDFEEYFLAHETKN